MKKQVALLTTALLATSFVLGATSCASKDVSKVLKSVSVSETTTAVSALTKDDSFMPDQSGKVADDQGLMVVSKVNLDADKNPVSTTQKLFDVTTNAYVSGAEVTKVDVPSVLDETNLFTVTSGLLKKTDGLYYSTKTVLSRASLLATDWNYETTISLYGKNGKVADNLEFSKSIVSTTNLASKLDELISSARNAIVNGVFTYKDGTRYYLDVNGNLAKEENPLARIVTLASAQDMDVVGDYLVDEDDYIYTVYSKDGAYVRTVNGMQELEIPITLTDEPVEWSVGNYMFMQYSVVLPENAKKFDYIGYGEDGAVKYDLITKRYDVEKGKVKEIDMEYVVVDDSEMSESFNDETALLYVSEIKDEQIMMSVVVQTFDQKGNVAVDLQALVPGATDVATAGKDYVVLTAGDMEYVVQGKKVIGEFVADSVRYSNGLAYTYEDMANNYWANASWFKFYNLDGTLNKSYVDFENVVSTTTSFVFELENSVVKFDLMTGTETTICTFGDDDSAELQGFYVEVNNANDATKADDDTTSIYWLIPGMTNLTNLTEAQWDEYSISPIGFYEIESSNSMTYGVLIVIAKTTGEGENETTTRTVYNYAMKQAY
jgi:hypothetical protein